MKMTFRFGKLRLGPHELSSSDFPQNLQGWVAFSMACLMHSAVHCADKKAAAELLMSEADEIINRVRESKPPVMRWVREGEMPRKCPNPSCQGGWAPDLLQDGRAICPVCQTKWRPPENDG